MKRLSSIVYFILFFAISFGFGQVQFVNKSQEKGINHYYQNVQEMGGGCAFADFNQDGWQDIWINGGNQNEKLYINDGTGAFLDKTEEAGLANFSRNATGVITGDIDNDGYKDVFLTTSAGTPNQLLYNNGDGSFSNISLEAGFLQDTAFSMSASFADINLDGYLDIYVGNYISELALLYDDNGVAIGFNHTCSEDYIYLNNKDNSFEKVSGSFWENQKGCVLASTFTDYDLDGDPDLMIANDFGEWIVPNRLFKNNYPNNSLTEVSTQTGMDIGIYAMGIAISDYDLDEDLDYYFTNLGRNVLLNNNAGLFEDKTEHAGIEDIKHEDLNTVGWGTSFQDLDLDMYPDLLVANGYIPAGGGSLDWLASNPENPNKLYLNKQDGSFEDISTVSGFANKNKGRGLAAADIDNDGDVDILVVHCNSIIMPGDEIKVSLYENMISTNNNFIKVNLKGNKSNRDGYGSLVRIYAGGRVLLRELNGGSSHVSHNSSTLHFGLSENTTVDSLVVTWPGGVRQTLLNPDINTTLEVEEDLSLYTSVHDQHTTQISLYPVPTQSVLYLLNAEENTNYKIYDQVGRQLLNGIGNRVPVEMLESGLYYLQVIDKGRVLSIAFVKA